jgi:pSer/pThr/pTyr-binding forkhead associated (FHA) protein
MPMQDQERTILAGDADGTGRTQALPRADATQMGTPVECPVCRSRNVPGDLYCWDCGFLLTGTPGEAIAPPSGPVAWLVDGRTGRKFALQGGINTVGRLDTDVLLSDPSVSRRHATIEVRGSDAVVTDCGSTNGTLVGGRRLGEGEQAVITAGQEVRFGNCALTFEMEAAAAEASPAAETGVPVGTPEPAEEAGEDAVPGQPEGEAGLDERGTEEPPEEAQVDAGEASGAQGTGVLRVRETGEEFRVGPDGASVGRRADNDIVLSDAYVSGRHAIIAFQDGAFHLTDAGSTNGTLVDGSRLEPNVPVRLRGGEEIRMGQLTLEFSLEGGG